MLLRSQRCAAQALVEFALVLPLMVTLSLGILQLALYAHARDVVLSSVQEAARLAAEEGRALDDADARARELINAGLGASLELVRVDERVEDEVVRVHVDGAMRPIVPLPLLPSLPVGAEASVAREHFRPDG